SLVLAPRVANSHTGRIDDPRQAHRVPPYDVHLNQVEPAPNPKSTPERGSGRKRRARLTVPPKLFESSLAGLRRGRGVHRCAAPGPALPDRAARPSIGAGVGSRVPVRVRETE